MGLDLNKINDSRLRERILRLDTEQNRNGRKAGLADMAESTPDDIRRDCEAGHARLHPVKPAKRIRQSTKPLMNKLESEFAIRLSALYPGDNWHPQGVTLRLANGLRYTPDFVCFNQRKVFEVKGPWVDGDSFPKLKMAASVFPELEFWLAWKDKMTAEWCEQRIMP